jgi:hypothetical protein
MAIEQLQFTITGTAPFLMHSNRGVNPREPLAKQLKAITAKRTKSEEDLDEIARIEWELGMYHDAKTGPYIPAEMMLACLRDAAKKTKQGKSILEAVMVDESRIPLRYDGPRDITGLYDDGRFFDLRPARVMGRTVNRARPIFLDWSASFSLSVDGELIDPEDICRILETAGRRVGLGDYRPTHGRFTVALTGRKEE